MKKSKVISVILAVILVGVCAAVLRTGSTAVQIGESEKFNENELQNALSCIKKEPITIEMLLYDEKQSEDILSRWEGASAYAPENLMAVCSDFRIETESYQDYVWILGREDKSDNWKIIDSGEFLKED